MTDADLVLEQLRLMRNDFVTLRREMQEGFGDMRERLNRLEKRLSLADEQ